MEFFSCQEKHVCIEYPDNESPIWCWRTWNRLSTSWWQIGWSQDSCLLLKPTQKVCWKKKPTGQKQHCFTSLSPFTCHRERLCSLRAVKKQKEYHAAGIQCLFNCCYVSGWQGVQYLPCETVVLYNQTYTPATGFFELLNSKRKSVCS